VYLHKLPRTLVILI
jgi:hypothetical protein